MTRHKKKATVRPLPKSFGSYYRLINENHHRSYLNRVLILKPQSLWSKERSVMSSEDLKDWKEEVSIGDPECKMQPLKLSILALTIKENWKQVGINHVPYIKKKVPSCPKFCPNFPKTMASRGNSSEKRKKILEELQQKACELSTILGSEVATKTSSNPLNQAGSPGSSSSSSRFYMPSFRRQFTTSGHNPFRGKGKGPFMRDVILLKGPDINSILRQEKRVY